MKQHQKLLLSLAAVAAIGTAGVGGTFAGFHDESTTGSAPFDSGRVDITATIPSSLGGADMVIGDSTTGNLGVSNDGDNKVKSLTIAGAEGSVDTPNALNDAVHVTIKDGTTTIVNDKSLTDFNAAGDTALTPTSSLAKGANHNYSITLTLKSLGGLTDDNDLQNLAGSEKFVVKAQQRDGTVRTTTDSVEL
jgi:predicted ribosomally synthesized peptide with SipW-like signal peptide